jgi:hypothetical protein
MYAAVADEHDERHRQERHGGEEKCHKSLLAARRSASSGVRSYKTVVTPEF